MSAQKSSRVPGSVGIEMRYSKISGTFLNFATGQHLETGVSYSSQKLLPDQHELLTMTYESDRVIETRFILKAPEYLEFSSVSDDARIPVITGRFLNTDYEECVLKASLTDKKVDINGVVTKLDVKHGLSTKVLTDSNGKTVGIMQERVELISEEDFKKAVNPK